MFLESQHACDFIIGDNMVRKGEQIGPGLAAFVYFVVELEKSALFKLHKIWILGPSHAIWFLD